MASPDLICYDQDTTVFPVRLTEDGSPHDITGRTLSWLFLPTDSRTVLHQIDVSEHADPSAGESSLEITPADVETIGGPGEYTLIGIEIDDEDAEITRVEIVLRVKERPARPAV